MQNMESENLQTDLYLNFHYFVYALFYANSNKCKALRISLLRQEGSRL